MMRRPSSRVARSLPYLGLLFVAGLSFVFVPTGQALWAKVLSISGTIETGQIEPPDFEGCSPGFWKQHKHLDNWPGVFSPTMPLTSVFGADAPASLTLLQALEQGGGGVNALLRQAVAALLNAAHDQVDYPISLADVILLTQAALLPGGNVEGTKDIFKAANELGCGLSDGEDEDGDDGENDNEDECEEDDGDEEQDDDGEEGDARKDIEGGDSQGSDGEERQDDEGDECKVDDEEDCESDDGECEDNEESSNNDQEPADGPDESSETDDSCAAESWRNEENWTAWPEGVTPEALFSEVFGVTLPESPTLFEALSLEGDGTERLMKAVTAALLNALSPASQSEKSAEEIIGLFQTAYLSGDPELVAVTTEQLEGLNVGDCSWLADAEIDTLTEPDGEALEPTPMPTPEEPTPTETPEPGS